MDKSKLYMLLFAFISSVCFAEDGTELQGIYEVEKAFLNETHCDRDGRAVEYASRFFRVNKTEKGLNIAICNGESLMELQCVGGYRSTNLNQYETGWSGLQYTARANRKSVNNPSCQLHALKRSIFPMKGGFLRYERTDWSENLRDFIAECNELMAFEYQDANSLKCNSHISIIGKKVIEFEE